MNDDCIKAQITAQFKARLKTMSGVAAVEEKRSMLQINNRWPFVLIEEDPIDEADNLQLQRLEYFIWYFPNSADQLVGNPGNPGSDNDTEAAYLARNAIADITVALNKDIYVAGLALNVEVDPGTDDIYMDGEIVLFGVWCKVIVTTNIEETDQYQNW